MRTFTVQPGKASSLCPWVPTRSPCPPSTSYQTTSIAAVSGRRSTDFRRSSDASPNESARLQDRADSPWGPDTRQTGSQGRGQHGENRSSTSRRDPGQQERSQKPKPSKQQYKKEKPAKSKSADAVAAAVAEQERRKGRCYGCGAVLQIKVPLGPGYVPPEKYEVKARHRQLSQVLCERCSKLANGAMIPAVEDFTQKLQAQALLERQEATEEALELLGKALITPDQLRQQLMEVRAKKAIVVMVVDLTDASGTLMGRVRDMVGNNPVILVGTKMDLLPEGTHPKAVADWLLEAALRKRLNVVSCHLVSSHNGEGVSAVTGKICRERKGRDVYVIGAANVGKSAFVRAMLKDMAKFESTNFDAAALANGRYLPLESPMPGTTIGIIPLQAFASGGTLYDTPGVHLHHRVPHMLPPEELKLLHPRKRLVPVVPPTPAELTGGGQAQQPAAEAALPAGQQRGASGKGGSSVQPVAGTYIWSDLVRVDVVGCAPSTSLAFYGPTTMRVSAMPLVKGAEVVPPTLGDESDADASTNSNAGSSSNSGSRVLACAQSVAARGGLVPHTFLVKVDGGRGPLGDIAVSGVPGWVTLWSPGAKRNLRVRVWAPKGVEVFLRPPLPVPPPHKALTPSNSGAGEEEEVELDEDALAALLAEYDEDDDSSEGSKRSKKGGVLNSARWWEAALAELEAIPEGDDEGEEDAEEEEEEKQVKRGRAGLTSSQRPSRGSGSDKTVVVSATVEDILRRPRLDMAFGNIEEEEEEEEDVEEEDAEEVEDGQRGTKPVVHQRLKGSPSSKPQQAGEDDEEEEDDRVLQQQMKAVRGRSVGVRPRGGGLLGRRRLAQAETSEEAE